MAKARAADADDARHVGASRPRQARLTNAECLVVQNISNALSCRLHHERIELILMML